MTGIRAGAPGEREPVYADNAATTLPKAPGVGRAMAEAVESLGNPGRSGHRTSRDGARVVFQARDAVARLFKVNDSRRVVFTSGCTAGINLALKGLLRPGDRVVTTSMEHNSVARPLRYLEQTLGLDLVIVPGDAQGYVDPDAMGRACRDKPTAAAVLCHCSNVGGSLQDLVGIRRTTRGTRLLVDAAQSAGIVPIDVDGLGIDFLAFPGHKGLLGPQGIGGLVLGPAADLPGPLVHGGTGSASSSDIHPDFLPDLLEAGTPNLPGLAGLAASVGYLESLGEGEVSRREQDLCRRMLAGLALIPGVTLRGPGPGRPRLGVFCLEFSNLDPGEVALSLERDFGIMVRSGLHCAPWAHSTLGTGAHGAVRFSFSVLTPEPWIESCLSAIRSIAQRSAPCPG